MEIEDRAGGSSDSEVFGKDPESTDHRSLSVAGFLSWCGNGCLSSARCSPYLCFGPEISWIFINT
ncbi:hypothetical protein HanXRQr2_Chr16g0744671 [Helianthus annuus]|uniref:Uncharacterized protein n=1 Tax=Helianthus annuus TaxID=4232 RepID=A0A9K3GYE6_HELAN|nr:hypothetical protein HanXRQr2_Chr16g0744671 [Helianthus annuus]KAJ0441964.1 hypothetical protein HanIR_Chr16g0803791 [Helianthus annuus]KAJ0820512.1 hypothetical protein HanPSC8_Chr16g0708891 [Helianthus annuus]KAJ0820932.1 hypothetical protein HanPSC8_Chr16g0713961 [Helianthus annuus]